MVLIKDYPLRGINYKEINEKKIATCTCGHFRHDHEIDMKKESHHGSCTSCLCPEYEHYMDMTHDQNWQLNRLRDRTIST